MLKCETKGLEKLDDLQLDALARAIDAERLKRWTQREAELARSEHALKLVKGGEANARAEA